MPPIDMPHAAGSRRRASLSIIIPTYQEAGQIGRLIAYLHNHSPVEQVEIIVADGGSIDGTSQEAQQAGADIVLHTAPGRAVQMNAGARLATAPVLYFLHADSFPPEGFAESILQAVARGYQAGCFRMRFDSGKWLLKINQFFTRLPFLFCRGGDQSLFITRRLFDRLGGFREELRIMEDFDFIQRIRQHTHFHILPQYVTTSARKYEHNAWWRVQYANFTIIRMWRKGASQDEMVSTYHRLLHYRRPPAGPPKARG